MSWKRFFRRRYWDEERARELQSYLEIEIEENIARGMSRQQAHEAAAKKLGNRTLIREEIYSMNTIGFLQTMWQDLRYAFRGLRLSPGFAAVAILSLALGIGANTAIFSLLNQVLLQALPVKDPQQLILLHTTGPDSGNRRGPNTFSYPMYSDLRDQSSVFDGMAARCDFAASLSHGATTERVSGELVSGNYFQVLGVQPAIGHAFSADDDRTPGAAPFVMLSNGYWHRRFGGDPSILGQSITVNGQPLTVIGVTPPGFFGVNVGVATDIFVPVMMKAKMTPGWDGLLDRRDLWLDVLARSKAGVSSQQADAGLNVVYHQVLQAEVNGPKIPADAKWRQRFVNKRITFTNGGQGLSSFRRSFSTPLVLLMGFVALVLLSACANIANLLMARGAARQREIAVRLALGAARTRIVRQLLVESVVLACFGGVLGVAISGWLGSVLLHMLPVEPDSLTFSAQPDLRVLLFTLTVSLATGIIFGLVPALQCTRPALAPTLKSGAANVFGGGAHARIRKALVVTQMALSLLLVIGAALFARSLYNLRTLDPGFQPDHLLEFSLDPFLSGYDDSRELALVDQLQQRIKNLPGVRTVSAGENPIFAGEQNTSTVEVEGHVDPKGNYINPNIGAVGPEYFSTLGVPILLGREFTARDSAATPKVGMINERAWHEWFGDQSPVGRHFVFGSRKKEPIEIVGVVRNSRANGLQSDVPNFVYIPYMQDHDIGQLTFFVRTSQEPTVLVPSIQKEIQQLDRDMPIFGMRTVETQLDHSLYVERMVAMLSAFFAGLAALLAAVGLYGVMAFTVARRTSEIGIRLALGASRGTVIWMVMKEVVWMACSGAAIALPLAIGLGRIMNSQLYGLAASDPVTIVAGTVLMLVVALFAGLIPASRASHIDPVRALRQD